MDFKELVAEMEKFKDTEDYNNYVEGLQQITPGRVTKFLETDEGKKFIQPTLDKYHNKGLESWKASSLPKIIDEEIKKRYPATDPKDLEVQKLQAEIENIKREASRKELMNKALKIATEKKLPTDIIDYFIGEDEKSTLKNLDVFEKSYTSAVSAMVDERLKSGSYTPAGNDKNNNNTDPFLQGLGL